MPTSRSNSPMPLTEIMNDPHVVELRYRIIPAPGVRFEYPRPLSYAAIGFSLKLEDDRLTVELKDHFAAPEDAQKPVNEFLKAWELSASLDHGGSMFAFEYVYADIIDRKPSPDKKKKIRRLRWTVQVHAVPSHSDLSVHTCVPPPPMQFAHIQDVEAMWNRYQACDAGKEPVASMAYFCLSLLERSAGGRAGASKMFGIDKDVLAKLGRLTSAVGDLATARKALAAGVLRSHAPEELSWMRAAVRELIRRMGKFQPSSAAAPPPLSMKDLPPLV